jgi:hypothetical protein
MQATLSEYLGTRYLHLGTPWVQGAMQIRKPNKLVLEYVQRMMAWLLFVPSAQWLGLGCAHEILHPRFTCAQHGGGAE